MSNAGNTTSKAPRIEKIDARIATLERREEHLSKRLEDPAYATRQGADFDRSEVAALRAGITALKYVREVAPC